VARGYAVVLQAARGTSYWDPEYRSEGVWEEMINEPADGAAALEWVTGQPWSDGQICMQGASYYGYTQWAAAMAGNPALKCLIPEVSMGTAFGDQPYMGGGFVEGIAFYMFWMLDHPKLPERNWTDIFHHRPLSDIDVYATGRDIWQWNNALEHWSNDEFWQRQDWYNSDTFKELATFQISGWFDDDFPGTERNWELVQRKSTQTQHLILGPWKHGYNFDRRLNGFSFGADALRDDIWLRKQMWYDHFLKGADNGIGDRKVEYFVLGADEWRTAGHWPPEEVEFTKWYFHSDGQANRLTTRGTLDTTPPAADEPSDRYLYDPLYPVPNWTNFDRMERWADIQSFPYDFKDIEARPDVVTFTSGVLEEDITIAGETMLVLYASTDVLDTDWWGHVADVHPDGSSVRLTTGTLRARFRNLEDPRYQIFGSNFVEEELLSGDPDDVVRFEIRIPAVANTFKKGHRIRIAVMNALDNYNFPNSNTGDDEAHVTETVVGKMVIHHTPEHPSHVVLPVLPETE
jgi:putative CocE/NonD family hydrolase